MISFNREFQDGTSKITEVRLAIELADYTRLSLTEEDVMLGGFTRDTSTSVDGEFTVGAAVTGKLTVVLNNDHEQLSRYDFRGATITASLGGTLTSGTHELIQVGIYTVDEYTYDGSNVTLVAYDNMHKLDVPCKGTSVTWGTNGLTLYQLVKNYACSVAGLTLSNSSIPSPTNYRIKQYPNQWDTMTWHDVISYVAQIAGCYAKILPNGRLYFSWYDETVTKGDFWDGGTFLTTTTPYSDGAVRNGGSFNPWNVGDAADGGTFGDRSGFHVLNHTYDLSVSTDDVQITGVLVTLEASDNINATDDTEDYTTSLYGSEGYVISIGGNPLIETVTQADNVVSYLASYLVGMRFRPLDASVLENPAIEAGDVAIVAGRNDNTYPCFVSNAVYTTNSATSISCDAATGMQNLKGRYTGSQKTASLIQRKFEQEVTARDAAIASVTEMIENASGLYKFEKSEGGGTVYIMGNHSTLAESDIQWKFNSTTVSVSTDYGRTFTAALTADGTAILDRIYAIGINASYITTGSLNANLITSGTITGRAIKGGSITGTSITAGGTDGGGLTVKNSSGSTIFSVNSGGATFDLSSLAINSTNFTLTKAGAITAKSGQIGGFTINGALYYGKTGLADITNNGIFIGTNGIIIGAGNRYVRISTTGDIYVRDSPWSGSTYAPSFQLDSSYGTTKISSDYNKFAGDIDVDGDLYVDGSLGVNGTKNRIVNTNGYGKIRLYSYETAEPTFGDIGEGVIGADGYCYVDIDPIFAETIVDTQYQVFIQPYCDDRLYVSERNPLYFVVRGTPGSTFGWEIKAKQYDFSAERLEPKEIAKSSLGWKNYTVDDLDYIDGIEQEMYGGDIA